jgi:hypothetical protein
MIDQMHVKELLLAARYPHKDPPKQTKYAIREHEKRVRQREAARAELAMRLLRGCDRTVADLCKGIRL